MLHLKYKSLHINLDWTYFENHQYSIIRDLKMNQIFIFKIAAFTITKYIH